MQALTDKGLDSLSALKNLSALSLAGADGLTGSGLTVLQQLCGLKVGFMVRQVGSAVVHYCEWNSKNVACAGA